MNSIAIHADAVVTNFEHLLAPSRIDERRDVYIFRLGIVCVVDQLLNATELPLCMNLCLHVELILRPCQLGLVRRRLTWGTWHEVSGSGPVFLADARDFDGER